MGVTTVETLQQARWVVKHSNWAKNDECKRFEVESLIQKEELAVDTFGQTDTLKGFKKYDI